VPGLPEALTAQILARAEGVPLYAVETVRMLLDRGLLVQEGSVYRPVGEIDSLEVPETLHALIAARLDGLTAEERRLLQDGAVLGKTFTQDGLASLSSGAAADLEPLLSALVRKEVLSRQADPRSPEHGQYGFLQDLVRHVAYETLSRHERKTRHLAAAMHLSATLADDDVAEVIASHLVEAHRAVPGAPDAAEIKARASNALARAGERAASLGAAAEAQRYFGQAAELNDDSSETAHLQNRAARMAFLAGDAVAARALYDQASTMYEQAGLQREAARISAQIGLLDYLEGQVAHAVERLTRALETLGDEEDAGVAEIEAALGRYMLFAGDPEGAAPHLERALTLAEVLDLPETIAEALQSKAILYMPMNRREESRLLLEGALDIALRYDLHTTALRAYNNLSYLGGMSDRLTEMLSRNDRALELARRVGDRVSEAALIGGTLGTLALLGRWDEALAAGADAAELASTPWAELSILDLCQIHCARGDAPAARALFDTFNRGRESPDAQIWSAHAGTELIVLLGEGNHSDALACGERVLTARDQMGVNDWVIKMAIANTIEAALVTGNVAKAREVLAILDGLRPGELTPMLAAIRARYRARIAAVTGEGNPGENFGKAETHYREVGTPFFLAVTLLEHAEWLIKTGQDAEAEPLLAEARATFERLKAAPWLERLQRVEPVRQAVLTETS
jgi:tetratricopeptide (TPR) repeat protein